MTSHVEQPLRFEDPPQQAEPAQSKDPPNVEAVQLNLPSATVELLRQAAETGAFGPTVDQVARSLVYVGLQQLVERGWIKLPVGEPSPRKSSS